MPGSGRRVWRLLFLRGTSFRSRMLRLGWRRKHSRVQGRWHLQCDVSEQECPYRLRCRMYIFGRTQHSRRLCSFARALTTRTVVQHLHLSLPSSAHDERPTSASPWRGFYVLNARTRIFSSAERVAHHAFRRHHAREGASVLFASHPILRVHVWTSDSLSRLSVVLLCDHDRL